MLTAFFGLIIWILVIAWIVKLLGKIFKNNPQQAMAVSSFLKGLMSKR